MKRFFTFFFAAVIIVLCAGCSSEPQSSMKLDNNVYRFKDDRLSMVADADKWTPAQQDGSSCEFIYTAKGYEKSIIMVAVQSVYAPDKEYTAAQFTSEMAKDYEDDGSVIDEQGPYSLNGYDAAYFLSHTGNDVYLQEITVINNKIIYSIHVAYSKDSYDDTTKADIKKLVDSFKVA